MVRKGQDVHQVYPMDLTEQVEALAKQRGISISKLYREAMRRELERENITEHQRSEQE